MLFTSSTEKFIINNLRAIDFAERLSTLVDSERRGLLSDNPTPLFGTIHRNSFKLWTNTILKSEMTGVYGEFHERNQNLAVYIEYSENFTKLSSILIPLFLMVTAIFVSVYAIQDLATKLGTTFFLLLFLIALTMAYHTTKKKTRAGISEKIRTLFTDKIIENLNEEPLSTQ